MRVQEVGGRRWDGEWVANFGWFRWHDGIFIYGTCCGVKICVEGGMV